MKFLNTLLLFINATSVCLGFSLSRGPSLSTSRASTSFVCHQSHVDNRNRNTNHCQRGFWTGQRKNSSMVTRRTVTSLSAVLPSSLPPSSTAGFVTWAVGHAIGGALGAPIVAKAISNWYTKIDLPSWTPPNRLFGPVWTVLYSIMGVTAYRIHQRTVSLSSFWSKLPMVMWWIHYVGLNLPWAVVFFGMKRLRLGLVLNILMVFTLGGVIIPLFLQHDMLAGVLLLPYLAWLMFATVLNYDICVRNPTRSGYNQAMFQADLTQLQKAASDYAFGE